MDPHQTNAVLDMQSSLRATFLIGRRCPHQTSDALYASEQHTHAVREVIHLLSSDAADVICKDEMACLLFLWDMHRVSKDTAAKRLDFFRCRSVPSYDAAYSGMSSTLSEAQERFEAGILRSKAELHASIALLRTAGAIPAATMDGIPRLIRNTEDWFWENMEEEIHPKFSAYVTEDALLEGCIIVLSHGDRVDFEVAGTAKWAMRIMEDRVRTRGVGERVHRPQWKAEKYIFHRLAGCIQPQPA